MEAINIKAYTADAAQIEALKAFMKALKIKFELTHAKNYEPEIETVSDNIKEGLKEVQQYKEGKLNTTTAKDFLSEF
jgi:phosphoribosylamine-glycine ligase